MSTIDRSIAVDCETVPSAAHRAVAAPCQVDALAEEVWLMRIKIFPDESEFGESIMLDALYRNPYIIS